ncbi:hypothetical protein AB0478_27935 [Streptomyces sp. NPDC051917]|uniref:hypothetical protein n=1 Tax=Streptomyces sp. NPDC051917 TaxID=3154754 RepID=UPI00344CD304
MPGQRESQLRQSGRLFAALAVLRLAAGADDKLRTLDGPDTKTHPRGRIGKAKWDLYDLLVKARVNNGGKNWEAAATAFRSIPDFLEKGNVPHGGLSPAAFAEFKAGYDAQISAFRDKFSQLLS